MIKEKIDFSQVKTATEIGNDLIHIEMECGRLYIIEASFEAVCQWLGEALPPWEVMKQRIINQQAAQ